MVNDQVLYRVEIELTDGSVETLDNATGEQIADIAGRFTARTGESLRLLTRDGVREWPWDQICGFHVLRMVALTYVDLSR